MKSRNNKLRMIVLGAGFWGARWIAALQQDPRCEIVAVAARTSKTLAKVQKEYGLKANICFRNYKQALNRMPADAAVVVMPPDQHYDVLAACLKAGLHILCEKPLTATWEQATQIAALAKNRSSQKFMVSQTRRWSAHIQTLKSVLDSGKIGKVSFINVDHRVHNRHPGWRETLVYPVLEDMAVHHFDAIRFFTAKEPVSVFAQSWNPSWSWYKGQACSSAIFKMTDEVQVNYFGSWCTQGQQTAWEGRIQVVGEKGSLDLVDEQTLHFYPSDPQRTPATNLTPELIPIQPIAKREIEYALNEFCEAIAQDRHPECDLADNLKTLAMACAAVKSCQIGAVVNVSTLLDKLSCCSEQNQTIHNLHNPDRKEKQKCFHEMK